MARHRRHKALGEVDLLGLNDFGQNPGLNPIWGALIGGTVAGGTTIVLRHSGTSAARYPEAFGLLAGLATSGAMYAMKSTRHAALGSLVGTFIGTGLAYLEKVLLGAATVSADAAAAGTAVTTGAIPPSGVKGFGIPSVHALNGLGIPQVHALNGFGMPAMSERSIPQGTIPGVAGNQLSQGGASGPPVSLLGATSPQAAHLLGLGGPAVHGLSASYGATLLGGGR